MRIFVLYVGYLFDVVGSADMGIRLDLDPVGVACDICVYVTCSAIVLLEPSDTHCFGVL